MGQLKTGLILGGVILAGVGGVLALTNPEPSEYADYAADELVAYAKQELCDSSASDWGTFLGNSCQTLLDAGRAPARELIRQQTQRQDFLLFSLYQTDLSFEAFIPAGLLDQSLPSYHVEAVGIFERIFIYKAEERP